MNVREVVLLGAARTPLGRYGGSELELTPLPWSADHYLAMGERVPEHAYCMLRDEIAAVLVGALGDPRVPDHRHARDILPGSRFERAGAGRRMAGLIPGATAVVM